MATECLASKNRVESANIVDELNHARFSRLIAVPMHADRRLIPAIEPP